MTLDDPRRLAAVAELAELQPQILADLSGLCEITALACDVPTAAVHLIDEEQQRRIAAYGVDLDICRRDESMCAVSVAGAQDVYLPDASADDRFRDNPWVRGVRGNVRFYAAALLWTGDGVPLGTLCLFDEQARELPPHRRRALGLLARQVVDVLELQLHSRRLEASLQDVARAQEQLTAFAGQVSHDLKTPLTTIRGFAELLAEQPSVAGDPEAAEFAGRIVRAGGRMIDTVEALLAYSRVGARLDLRAVGLDATMRAVLADLGTLADDADVIWHGPDVHADPVHLRALLQNLVGNALKYRRPGVRATVTVWTTCLPDGGRELAVADNGPGIPAQRRDEALRPLGRLHTDVPGTGLGLATCTRIAAAHGGTLELDDTPGGGTTVRVRLAPLTG